MNNKYIDELHRVREANYEETKDVSFEEKQKRINRGATEFLKLVDHARQEQVKV